MLIPLRANAEVLTSTQICNMYSVMTSKFIILMNMKYTKSELLDILNIIYTEDPMQESFAPGFEVILDILFNEMTKNNILENKITVPNMQYLIRQLCYKDGNDWIQSIDGITRKIEPPHANPEIKL